MRKLLLLMLVTFLSIPVITHSQITNWSQLTRLTTGNFKDINPDFTSPHYYSFFSNYFGEFMVFQRQYDSVSQICVLRFDKNGPSDSIKYLTTGNFFKRNPCIAYKSTSLIDTLKYALALWESNQNGKWDIYASYYTPSGWGLPFPMDSLAGNKFNPKVIQISETDFGIVYTRDDDIIYRRYNAQTRTVVNEFNITSTLSAPCSNCLIVVEGSSSLRVNFRLKKPDNNFCIYKSTSGNFGSSWSTPDTLAYVGNNLNVQLVQGYSTQQIFESNRSGKNAIYNISNFGAGTPEIAISSPYFNYYGLKTWYFPIITESINSNISAVIRKSTDSTKILFNFASASVYARDSVSAGDTSKNIRIALNSGIRYEDKISFFTVFNLDSAGFTSLYFKNKVFITSDINIINNTLPNSFYLYQNYPNPFNPVTKIKFKIPKLSDVKITIYDALGKEVSNIFKAGLTTGSYEYDFNGENLSSGVYYYNLETKDFSKTMKMILLK